MNSSYQAPAAPIGLLSETTPNMSSLCKTAQAWVRSLDAACTTVTDPDPS